MATKEQEEARALLREKGLRATPSRVAVLQVLENAPRPMSHAEMVEALSSGIWNRTTIYRNLTDLVKAGLAKRIELGDRVWRFSLPGDGTHPHFVCTECGEVLCMKGTKVVFRPKDAGPAAVRDRDVEIQIRGECDECRAARGAAMPEFLEVP
jgi:Fur family ferric uptake transcriptional regulator